MTRTVSLELAKKLHEAFGWDDTFAFWEQSDGIPLGEAYLSYPELERRYGLWGTQEMKVRTPAPDTDYLLDKLLPATTIEFVLQSDGRVLLIHYPEPLEEANLFGDTPAEALGLLALKLKEEGIFNG